MESGDKSGLKNSSNSEDFIRSLIDLVFEITKKYKNIITFLYSGMSYYHSLESWEAIYDPYYLWLEEIFVKFQRCGEFRGDQKTATMVQFVIGIIEHTAETYYLFKRENGNVNRIKNDLFNFILTGCKEHTV